MAITAISIDGWFRCSSRALSETEHRGNAMRDSPQNIRATTEGHPHWLWITPSLNETQRCIVLCETYRKTFEQRQEVVHTGVG